SGHRSVRTPTEPSATDSFPTPGADAPSRLRLIAHCSKGTFDLRSLLKFLRGRTRWLPPRTRVAWRRNASDLGTLRAFYPCCSREDVAMKKLDPYLSPNPDLAALLHPAQAFAHPRDVVDDPDLTLNEKRAILASWVSDACAVEAADEILRALRALDAAANATAWARRQVRRE